MKKEVEFERDPSCPIARHTPKSFMIAGILGIIIGLAIIVPGVSGSTVAIINTASGLDLLQIPDSCGAPTIGRSNFRVSNLARNTGPLDVALADGRVIFGDVRFKETTAFKNIQPGTYEFLFAETDQTPMPAWLDIETLDSAFIGMYPLPNMIASLYLNVRPNLNYTAYLISSGTDHNAVQVLVTAD